MRLTHLLGLVAAFFFSAGFISLFFSTGCTISYSTMCLFKVKEQARCLLIYASDTDDALPVRDAWMDRIAPIMEQKEALHDSEGSEGGYGYAFNAALSNVKTTKVKKPEEVSMIYDSLNPIRNASDLFASLPRHGRHPVKEPTTSTIGYADGHVRSKRMEP